MYSQYANSGGLVMKIKRRETVFSVSLRFVDFTYRKQ